MLRAGLVTVMSGCLQYGQAQYVLCSAGEAYALQFGVRYLLVREDPGIDEGLHLVDVGGKPLQCEEGIVVPVSDQSEHQVVRSDAVAPGPHRLLSGIGDYAVQYI